MPLILFTMIGMPALVNGIMIAAKERWIRKRQVRSQNRCLCVLKREMMSTEELIAEYIEKKCIFWFRQRERSLEKEKWPLFTKCLRTIYRRRKKGRCQRFASGIRSVGQEIFYWCTVDEGVKEVMLNAKLQQIGVLTKEERPTWDDNQMVVTRQWYEDECCDGISNAHFSLYVIINASVIASTGLTLRRVMYWNAQSYLHVEFGNHALVLIGVPLSLSLSLIALHSLMALTGSVPEMNWECITGLLAVTIIYSLCLNLFFFRIFKYQDMRRHLRSVCNGDGGAWNASSVWGFSRWKLAHIVAYINRITGCTKSIDLQTSSHQSGLSLRWQGPLHCRKLPPQYVQINRGTDKNRTL